MIDEVDEILEHYGVKGQRWGVRKTSAVANVGTAASVTAGIVAGRFVMSKTFDIRISAITAGAVAYTGARITRNLLNKHGAVRINDPRR
jgi:hypothetical protein